MVVVMASRRASMDYKRLHPGGGHTEPSLHIALQSRYSS